MFALFIFCVKRNNPSKFRDSCLARAATAAESLRDLYEPAAIVHLHHLFQ